MIKIDRKDIRLQSCHKHCQYLPDSPEKLLALHWTTLHRTVPDMEFVTGTTGMPV